MIISPIKEYIKYQLNYFKKYFKFIAEIVTKEKKSKVSEVRNICSPETITFLKNLEHVYNK